MKKIVMTTLFILLGTITGLARDDKSSWDNVIQLKPGKTVHVRKADQTTVKGKLLRVSEDAIALEIGKKEVSVPRSDIQRVQLKKGNRLLRGLAGAGIGAAIGAAILFSAQSESGFYGALPAVPLLAGAGAGAGAAIPVSSTVYER